MSSPLIASAASIRPKTEPDQRLTPKMPHCGRCPGLQRTLLGVVVASPAALVGSKRLIPSHDIEELLIDFVLAEAMKTAVELLEQAIDILVGALHGGQPAGALAGQRFGAGAKERHEQIFAYERRQCRRVRHQQLGQTRCR